MKESFDNQGTDMMQERLKRVKEDYVDRHEISDTSIAYLVVAHAPVLDLLATEMIRGRDKFSEKFMSPPLCSSFEMIISEEDDILEPLKEINDDYVN